ncbi:hypothetical protein ES288_A05G251600v1 [Gossypium darwinii]|uniref:RING-type E3 ubiquitin transferase n=1 Tax=Gossypium darwinii TaxID=34276 RepID=A0A5D2GJD1_GOSDA|nr:hypothetical protein ES288_A05G251600v1 [Gossypium darwinii]
MAASIYCIKLREVTNNLEVQQRCSHIPRDFFNIIVGIRDFNESVTYRRDTILYDKDGPNILLSLLERMGAPLDYIRTLIVPSILSYARQIYSNPLNSTHKLISFEVEVIIKVPVDNVDDEADDNNDEVNEPNDDDNDDDGDALNFKPATCLSKRRRLREGLSSTNKECAICLNEFLEGDEVASICTHVFHDGCIVKWLKTSHLRQLCRQFMLAGQDGDESVLLPTIPLVKFCEHVCDDGIYLENGEDTLIYFGSSVDSSILQQLFGFTSVDEVPTQTVAMEASIYPMKLREVTNNLEVQQRYSHIPYDFFNIVVGIRFVSSLNKGTTLGSLNESVIYRRDTILSDKDGPNILLSLLERTGAPLDYIRTLIVPGILSYAWQIHSNPLNFARKLISFEVEVIIKVPIDDDDDEVDEPNDNEDDDGDGDGEDTLNFKPVTCLSVQALRRYKWGDDEEQDSLPLKKMRRLREGLNSTSKECAICLDEFSEGDEVASMPCTYVFYDGCIVKWLKNNHLYPLCRFQMPA